MLFCGMLCECQAPVYSDVISLRENFVQSGRIINGI